MSQQLTDEGANDCSSTTRRDDKHENELVLRIRKDNVRQISHR